MIPGVSYAALFLASVALYILGGLIPFVLGEKRAASSFVLPSAASLLVVATSASMIFSGSTFRLSSPVAVPTQALVFSFYADGMSAFFMLMIGLVGLSVSVYSLGYARSYLGRHSVRALALLFNMFVVSMLLVTATDNVFSFLVFWELMSLTSFFLVVYEHEKPANLRTGLTYLVTTHIGTALVTSAFLLLYFQTGSLSFDAFRAAAPTLSALAKDSVFVLALAGFGTKAGLVPMHTWLPRAHPSAPSSVSALMSGAMLKVPIYGLALVTLDFVVPDAPADAWLGLLMVGVGAVSALVGVVYASVDVDLKRSLAYSSVENVGMIVVSLGLSVVFMSYGLTALAALAVLASMYQALNHAVFKSLLFMAAGAVVYATGTADMNRMGGLAKRMPWTSLLFLVGSVAIAGLPPLNGFVSEWLALQALLSSYRVPSVAAQLGIGFASVAFALTIGLALATFVKLFGVSFLARPRSPEAEAAVEAPRWMLAGMGAAASLCVALGVLPLLAASTIASSFGFDLGLVGSYSPFGPLAVGYVTLGARSVSELSMSTVLVLACCVGAALFGFVSVIGSGMRTVTRPYSTWDGGFGPLGARTEYTATSVSQPLRTAFKWFLRPKTEVKREYYSGSNPLLKRSVTVVSGTKEVFEDYLLSPVVRGTLWVMGMVRRIQTGKINAYLLYIMLATAFLLLVAAFQP